jgi:hypothetical protein
VLQARKRRNGDFRDLLERKETIRGKWQIPPAGGHMESPNGLYLQTMSMTQVNERLGLSYEEISKINPRIIYASI